MNTSINDQFPDIAITLANKDDYPELVQVWEASVRATHDFLIEEDILYFKSLVPMYFDAVDLYLIRNEDGVDGFMGVAEQEIQMLFLHPGSLGKGIGKTFVQFAIRYCNAIKVEVNEQNVHALGFYQHMGFEIVGRSQLDYTGKPYPILSMQLRVQL